MEAQLVSNMTNPTDSDTLRIVIGHLALARRAIAHRNHILAMADIDTLLQVTSTECERAIATLPVSRRGLLSARTA